MDTNKQPSPTPEPGEKDEERKKEIMQSAMALVRSGYTHAVLEIADLVKDKNIDLPVELSDKLLDMLNEDSKKQFNALLFEKELSAIDHPHSPVQALTTDEEAAEKFMMTNIHAPLSKAFLAGCTHVRAQQACQHNGLITTDDTGLHRCYNCLMTWRGQKPQPVDAVALNWGSIFDNAHKIAESNKPVDFSSESVVDMHSWYNDYLDSIKSQIDTLFSSQTKQP